VKKNAKLHLEKMKKDCDDLELQNQAGAKMIEAWSQKCNKLMTEQEALNGKCKTLIKERETWKHACVEMAKGIAPVLDIIGPDSTEAGAETPKIGLTEKSQKAWGWLQQWTKDIKEYVGAHVLSLVRAHYPLLEIAHLEAGYPREVGAEQADELRSKEMKHAATITKDIILCLATAPSTGGTIQLYVGQIPMPPSLASSGAHQAPSSTTPKVAELPKGPQ
jgi:hypothetical protein